MMNINSFPRAVVVCLFFAAAAFSQDNFRVDESKTQAFFQNERLLTNLVVVNDAARFSAEIRLEILDETDKIIAQNIADKIIVNKGENLISVPTDFFNVKSVSSVLWYRLRYTISDGKNSRVGIVSFSEIVPELFNLRASGGKNIYAGQNYIVRVSAFHPTKGNFIGGVKLAAELTIETADETADVKVTSSGETNGEGFAELAFQIPANIKISDDDYYGAEIKVSGEKNNLLATARENLQSEGDGFRVFLNADKPIYQPEQKIRVRGLALSENAILTERKTAAGKDLEFLIKDEDDLVLYRENVKTSRFGIAGIEWQIPENAKIGTYRVEVKSDVESSSDSISFKVSRYELPNFVVKTDADKDFYLPDEKTAEVTVDAVYLFGKPVEKGMVKIVRESDRKWNYEKQKWDVTEEETFEGETDADGKFKAKINLSKAHEELAGEDDDKFEDLNFTAYFTDLTNNKTEQRRFDIRVTKEAIHVYFVGFKDDDQNPKLPVEFYVTAFSANGAPQICDVEIKTKPDGDDDDKYKTAAKSKTNRFGASKVEFRVPKEDDGEFDDIEIKAIARCGAERKIGTITNELDVDEDEVQIIVRTEKTIYKKGETVKISLLSSEAAPFVFVDVSRYGSNLVSRNVKLKNGRGEIEIPYAANFKNQLTVSAYFDDGDGDEVQDSKMITFPESQNLRVELASEKDVFKPNEEAKLDVAVFSPNKTKAENAPGIVNLFKNRKSDIKDI